MSAAGAKFEQPIQPREPEELARPMVKRSIRSRRFGAAALGLALFASACGGGGASDGEAATAGESSADVAEESGGAGLPQLVADTVAGAQLDTNDLAGQDLVVWFWAPW